MNILRRNFLAFTVAVVAVVSMSTMNLANAATAQDFFKQKTAYEILA